MLGRALFLVLLSGPVHGASPAVEANVMSHFDTLNLDPAADARAERTLDRLTRSVLRDILQPARSGRARRSPAAGPLILAGDSLPGEVGRAVAEEVRVEVADRWGVAPERVGLEWGPLPEAFPAGMTEVRILGTGSGGHWVVLVRDPAGQTTNLRVRAGVRSSVPVAARPLDRGDVLQEGDIEWAVELGWGPPPPRKPPVNVGWEVRRRIREGERLTAPAVTRPDLVRSGEALEVVWKRGPIAISLRGEALGTGALGETVRVRTEHGRRLTGTVLGRGVVMVGAGGTGR